MSSWSSVTPWSGTTGEKVIWGKSATMVTRHELHKLLPIAKPDKLGFEGLTYRRLIGMIASKAPKV